MHVLKSRGMAHSNQLREFLITDKGLDLVDVYLGPQGVLTGSARAAQESRKAAEALTRSQEIERKQRDLQRRRMALEAKIASLRTNLEAEEEELEQAITEARMREDQLESDRTAMARSRRVSAEDNSTGE